MSGDELPPLAFGEPVEGVIFDLVYTLVNASNTDNWLADGWRKLGREGDVRSGIGEEAYAATSEFMRLIWTHADDIDPDSRRDLSTQVHREVYDDLLVRHGHLDREYADALYDVMVDSWTCYADTLPVLGKLRHAGIKICVLTNVGMDIGPALTRMGVAEFIDDVVMSYDVGHVKPEPAIFQRALDGMDVSAERALMVGDTWHIDSGAAQLGIRTLLLPRTFGDVHGLGLVLRAAGL